MRVYVLCASMCVDVDARMFSHEFGGEHAGCVCVCVFFDLYMCVFVCVSTSASVCVCVNGWDMCR